MSNRCSPPTASTDDLVFDDVSTQFENDEIIELGIHIDLRGFRSTRDVVGPRRLSPGYLPRQGGVLDNDYVEQVEHDGASIALARAPVHFDDTVFPLGRVPSHGAHTDEVLLAIGVEPDELQLLRDRRIVS